MGRAARLPSRLPRNKTWLCRRIKRLKDLERENATLKPFLADAELAEVDGWSIKIVPIVDEHTRESSAGMVER